MHFPFILLCFSVIIKQQRLFGNFWFPRFFYVLFLFIVLLIFCYITAMAAHHPMETLENESADEFKSNHNPRLRARKMTIQEERVPGFFV